MNDANRNLNRRPQTLAIVWVFLVNVLAALLLLDLIGAYWNYWRIGGNNAARSTTLVFLYAPVVFAVFLAAFAIVWAIAARLKTNGWQTALLGTLIAAVVFCILFALEARNTADYPVDREGDLADFLAQYLKSRF